MPMGPAEIVASLKELCESQGPMISTGAIVDWIDEQGGYESDVELIAFAKKMKARQYARMLMFDDEETGRKIKRLWSFPGGESSRRAYSDILAMPPEKRRALIDKYVTFLDQLTSVRRAMTDYLAGQEFFDFYVENYETEEATTNA